MAQVIIGGTPFLVSELNFIAMERVWPDIEMAMMTKDPMQSVGVVLAIIGGAVMEEDYFTDEKFGVDRTKFDQYLDQDTQVHKQVTHFLKRKLKAGEIEGVRKALWQIMEEAGLKPEAGEGSLSEVMEKPSTETSTPLSPNSSEQDVKAEAGTASESTGP